MPDEYYTHKYSGEEIDAILDDARQSLKNVANDSLIVNGDFRSGCLVDQRRGYVVPPTTGYYSDPADSTPAGSTTAYYTATIYNDYWVTIEISGTAYYVPRVAAVRGYVGAGYGIDMWRIGSSGTLIVKGDHITFSSNDSTPRNLEQSIERLPAGTYTLSALVENGGSASLIVGSDNNYHGQVITGDAKQLVSLTFTRTSSETGCIVYLQCPNKDVAWYAAKLELGDTQTLAHQDSSGNWVLNEVPSYADTLRECQRYFVRFGASDDYHTLGVGLARDTTYISIPVALPVQMRTRPTVSISGNITLRQSDMTIKSSAAVYVDAGGVGATLLKIATADLTAGDIWEAHLPPQNYLSLSAEL